MSQFNTYKTPQGTTVLVDTTNDLGFILNDLAPVSDAKIVTMKDKPSAISSQMGYWELVEEGSNIITAGTLQNVQVSENQSAEQLALATYLLAEYNKNA